jgi:multiple sugar transport system permease protein
LPRAARLIAGRGAQTRYCVCLTGQPASYRLLEGRQNSRGRCTMVDVAFDPNSVARTGSARKRSSLRTALKRKSTAAFLMTLPLILLVAVLVIYPAFYSLHLATLNKSMQRFVGLGNFAFLFKRETFWLVVKQSCIFAISAVFFKALIGFIVAHFVHNVPAKGQRKWRGMLLVPWVIPPAMSTLAWLWLFDPSYSAFNYTLSFFGIGPIPWTGDAAWARFSVILVNVWFGAPFFMIMYLAALKSVPEQLYEAAAIDGANWWQRIWFVTLPMMRNIIAITTLFSLIVTFANFDIVRILTAGGPLDHTHLFATWAFRLGIEGGDIPLGASVSLFMFPILAIAAIFILRDINKRGNEA